MRAMGILAGLLLAVSGGAETQPNGLWTDLSAKRAKLVNLHQEFDVTRTLKTGQGNQSSKWRMIVDVSGPQWREQTLRGSGNHLRIFDGDDLFSMAEGDDEFVRVKRHPKDESPLPPPYDFKEPDWSKAAELERRPCGIPGSNHTCVLLEAPIKPWMALTSAPKMTKMSSGSLRMFADIETGLLLSLQTFETIENQRGVYQSETAYVLKRFKYGGAGDAGLFKLPSGDMREVKELSRWDAGKIKKQLTGNPAPELTLTDIQGKPVALSAAKGETVLLDFFTTWCPPCRADAPALDKLYSKYGQRDLMIVGISVSEERAIVEKFLQEHPHSFPIALTTENEMPRPYQIGVFPTYIVINPDGTLASAVQGQKGFADLRKLLKKAGLDVE